MVLIVETVLIAGGGGFLLIRFFNRFNRAFPLCPAREGGLGENLTILLHLGNGPVLIGI